MKGTIIWLTGNSGAGKTTIAEALKKRLYQSIILDGDIMRRSISLMEGFSKADREEHNLRVARLSKELSEQGHNVIVPVIAPFSSTREKIEAIIPTVKWVFVDMEINNWEEYPYEVPTNPLCIVTKNKMKVEEQVSKIINDLRLFNVFVFGMPRSGTSMHTGILERLGVNMIYTTEEKKERQDKRYKKHFGEYHPNKTGFFEITKDFLAHYLGIVNGFNQGCKMIIPVDGQRFDIVKDYPAKVIMTWRDPEEIRQSQRAFYRDKDVDVAWVQGVLAREKSKLKKLGVDFIISDYRELVDDPRGKIQVINDFIRGTKNIDEAINFVNPKATRFKVEELEVGL